MSRPRSRSTEAYAAGRGADLQELQKQLEADRSLGPFERTEFVDRPGREDHRKSRVRTRARRQKS